MPPQHQPHPQHQPQYGGPQPGSIPQQPQYAQAETYAQYAQPEAYTQQQPVPTAASPSQPLPPPVPHPNPLPQAESYPERGGALVAGDGDGRDTAPNTFATAGAVTSFVPVIGLLLSLVGLVRSRGPRAGKKAARVGVVLSLVFSAAWGVAGYYGYKSAYAKATDPGCVSADADFLGYSTQMQDDAAAMATAAGSAGGARSAAFTAAVHDYQENLAKLVADFDADSAKAAGASLKTAIQAVSADLTGLDTDFGYVATGNYAAAADLMDLNAKLITDFQTMEDVCRKS
jgi:hypothetical protein